MSPDIPPDKPEVCCQPAVDVDIDGERFPGKVRSCDELADGSWSCLVTVQLEPGQVRTARVDPKNLS